MGTDLTETSIGYASWTQTQPTTNTSVSAVLEGFKNLPGHAWLMNRVGPGTTKANEIAQTDFFGGPPVSESTNAEGLTDPVYNTLFTGLSLAPGTYYLVLQGSSSTRTWVGVDPNYAIQEFQYLYGKVITREDLFHTAPGFTVGPFFSGGTNAAYIPASDIPPDPNMIFYYRVEAEVAPLPNSLVLMLSGLVVILGKRLRWVNLIN